jgi:superfamily I DNA and/or RNA helicase
MNLYQINTDVDTKVILNADYDLRRYIEFINKSIEFLKKETLSIQVKKIIIEKEVRYEPILVKKKKDEKAIDALFNENTNLIYDQNTNFYNNSSIRVIEQNEAENYVILESEIENDTIYLRPNTHQLTQQKNALENLRHRPLQEHKPLLNLFGYPDSIFWNQYQSYQDFDWKILTDVTRNGTKEQQYFVSKAIQSKDFALLEGPPGSGKTTTIIELIMQYAKEGKRVLLCSATHAAIDNVIERIKGKYKNTCDEEIVPVRISRFEKPIKESVRPYLLKNIISTYKKDIEKHLKKNQTLKSQQFLLENINKKDDNNNNDLISKIILDSANLVAGTMIGILQHPDIKANKLGASFDVLIVDEASKVTFSDFIVPALHSKRWILVGDVKQLSPYVENDYVSENIASMLNNDLQKTLVNQFELKTKINDDRYEDCIKIYFTENDLSLEKEYIQNENLITQTISDNFVITEQSILILNSADILIANNSNKIKKILSKYIYVKCIYINGETNGPTQKYRQNHFRKDLKRPLPYLFDSRQDEWSEMVSSRLNQSFSFRNTKGFENVDNELEYLIPTKKIKDEINQIKRLVFPSILELLQNGIGKGENQRSNRVLSDGFTSNHKESRFVSLSYQHRMHPDIAKTSKENFYENNLETANTILENNNWNYALNEPRVKWIHDNDKTGKGNRIFNPTEINNIEKELLKFLKWAKDNPKIENDKKIPYEIAILSFYLNQEAEIRKRIRKLTKQFFFSKFHKDNCDIFVYTVDKFQGQEADIVFLGFTKFSPNAHYNSPNRLNVALTRARHKLVLFGNKPWFAERAKLKALRELATNFESTKSY